MDGGDGIDTLDYSADSNGVVVNLKTGIATGTTADGDKFKNFENVTGTVYDDVLTGDDNDNVLDGVSGNDTLIGGLGHDTLKGGTGSNIYVIDDADDTIVEAAGGGTDLVKTSLGTYTLTANVENLTLTGNANSTGIGNALANTLTGNDSDNTLDSGKGAADSLYGGKGNDTYVVHQAGDYIYEYNTTDGTDTVIADVSYTLNGWYIENLTLAEGAGDINGTGQYWDNTITGNSGKNTLDGGALNDVLIGGGGG